MNSGHGVNRPDGITRTGWFLQILKIQFQPVPYMGIMLQVEGWVDGYSLEYVGSTASRARVPQGKEILLSLS